VKAAAAASGTATVEKVRAVVRVLVSLAMVLVGIDHFANPVPFARIVPAELPAPRMLVYVSGAFEILLGAALFHPRMRRLAGYGLVALYVAVFPANINMAVRGIALDPEHPLPTWVTWVRLPFQLVFIALALWVSRPPPAPS
jgi:uncharacterized membrane protein